MKLCFTPVCGQPLVLKTVLVAACTDKGVNCVDMILLCGDSRCLSSRKVMCMCLKCSAFSVKVIFECYVVLAGMRNLLDLDPVLSAFTSGDFHSFW